MKALKHGAELREFWRIQKSKYRARRKAKAAKFEGETAKASDPAPNNGEPNQ